ncbi:MAG: enoyl-CoA hydratase/isomerase family protein, partial [Dehalococcoidia bacterium]|nr:enoyl-CoA hydratase/isomerase family protein [Dehalococcoidia bacterium]
MYTTKDYKYLLIEKHQGIVVMSLNRPAKLNAINIDMSNEIHSALNEISSDKGCLVLIIPGSGRGFCSGWDL